MRLKTILPILVIVVAVAGAFALLATRATVTPRPQERRLPSVRVMTATPDTVQLQVRSQGTVMPRTESQLIPEVSGTVVWTSPALVSGGYFEKGESLVGIDPAEYRTAIERAHANLSRTIGEFEYAQSELKRQQKLAADQIVAENRYEEAQRTMRVADANLRDAKAALDQAQRELHRTQIRAPFRGRVRDESVDVGQFVNRGSPFATLYATDFLEVRLPIPDDQLAYFDVPLWQRSTGEPFQPRVRLHTRFAGEERSWWGRVVRTEGEIDPQSRMVHVIARVESAAAAQGGEETPLPVGLFVQADIQARAVEGVYVLPRSALWDEEHVVIADSEDRLRRQQVEVLRIDRDEVYLSAGLAPGDRVCVSPPADLIDGQQVHPFEDSLAAEPEAVDS